MITPFENGRVVRAAQEEIVLLKQQLAALMAQVAALATQVAVEAERAALAEGQALIGRERLDALEAVAPIQAAAADGQASRLEELCERWDRNEEATKQGRGDLARVEKQVQAELAELRRFNADLATTIHQWGEVSPR